MADDSNDDVFVFENGIVPNQNVPLILQHDSESDENFEIEELDPLSDDGDQVLDEDGDQVMQEVEGGYPQEALQNQPEGLDENGNFVQNEMQVVLHGEPVGFNDNENVNNVAQNEMQVVLHGEPVGFNDNENVDNAAHIGFQAALQGVPVGLNDNENLAQIGFQLALQGIPVGFLQNANVAQNAFQALQDLIVAHFENENVVQNVVQNGFQVALQVEHAGPDENENVAQNDFQIALQGGHEGSEGNDNVSLMSISPASSSFAFDQSDILGASSPMPNQGITGYVNEGYQSDFSELSELSTSVELQSNTLTASCREQSRRLTSISEVDSRDVGIQVPDPDTESGVSGIQVPDPDTESGVSGIQVPDLSTSSHEEGQLSVVRYTPSNATDDLPEARNTLQVASSSSHDNSERIHPNPPNSPALARGRLLSPQHSRRCQGENHPIRVANNPDLPYKIFVQFGTFLLILAFLFILAIVACLQDILPHNHMTVFAVLSILCLIGTIGCYVKACCVGQEEAEETPRVSYGSTETTEMSTQTTRGSSGNTRPDPPDTTG